MAASPAWLTGRRIGVAALFLYGIVLIRRPDEYRLLDSVDLAIHETGHLVFAPFVVFLEAGLNVLEVHRPPGNDRDPFHWVSEYTIAPWTIHVLTRTAVGAYTAV